MANDPVVCATDRNLARSISYLGTRSCRAPGAMSYQKCDPHRSSAGIVALDDLESDGQHFRRGATCHTVRSPRAIPSQSGAAGPSSAVRGGKGNRNADGNQMASQQAVAPAIGGSAC